MPEEGKVRGEGENCLTRVITGFNVGVNYLVSRKLKEIVIKALSAVGAVRVLYR
jgi:hypothetical protein